MDRFSDAGSIPARSISMTAVHTTGGSIRIKKSSWVFRSPVALFFFFIIPVKAQKSPEGTIANAGS